MQKLFPDWRQVVVYSAGGPQPKVLAEHERFKALIGGLEPGQKIPPHPEGAAVYYFLTGTGWMIVDGERYPVAPGAVVVVPAGAARGVEAEERLAFLAARSA